MININRTSIFLAVDRWHVEQVAATPRPGYCWYRLYYWRPYLDGWNCNFLQNQALGVSHVELKKKYLLHMKTDSFKCQCARFCGGIGPICVDDVCHLLTCVGLLFHLAYCCTQTLHNDLTYLHLLNICNSSELSEFYNEKYDAVLSMDGLKECKQWRTIRLNAH